ncbi:hypothetical protein B5T_03002 [Alloalcanivorax dieselolei B5]|uniref:Uncharacterized protein n=1 Tax=Alcanivorax dieselolei (strain DSM 16502 / CGMCC 1.3690 / MCCC 1A00001 / B-5) TaxID=930169 RepID=K0CG50_ALCDB|nr:hypothetical protein B5T_03002 [Alloalcanivorax dieselolei B5]
MFWFIRDGLDKRYRKQQTNREAYENVNQDSFESKSAEG